MSGDNYTKYAWRLVWIFALVIRFLALDQSLWLDEATTAQVVRTLSFPQILTVYAPHDFHPPLYYLLLKAWTVVFGTSVYSLRMPSVLLSLATGYLVYRLVMSVQQARKISPMQATTDARYAAALFLFNPLILYYSQEARMYMTAVFLATALVYACWPIFLNRALTRRQVVWTNVLTGLLFATFYASAFFIASLHMLFIIRRKWRDLLRICPGGLTSVAILSPLLITQLRYSSVALASVANWSLVLGKAEFKNLILLPLKFAVGRYDLNTTADMILVGAWTSLLFVSVIYGVFRLRYAAGRKTIWSAVFLAVFPVVIGYVVSFYKPMMQYFRFLYVVPFILISLVLAIRSNVFRTIIIAGSVAWCLVYVLGPAHHREDWRTLTDSLPDHATVYMIPSSSDPVKYYRPDIRIADVRALPNTPGTRQIIIPYTFAIHGVDTQQVLKQAGKTVQKHEVFRGVEYIEVN